MIGMPIRRRMCNRNRSCLIFWVVLLSGFLVISLEKNSENEKTFLRQFIVPDERMVESLLTNCGQDVDCVKEAVEEFNLCLPVAKDNVEKHIFLDCVGKSRKALDVFGHKVGFEIHRDKYLKVSLSLPSAPRRNLASKPSPGPSPSLGTFAPSPKHSRIPPTRARAPSPWNSFFPPKVNMRPPPPPPPAKKNSSSNSRPGPGKGGDDNHKTVIIAVIVTAVVTFMFAALCFLCCMKVFGHRSGGKQNDERPLLSLSMNDYSVGSSLKYGGSTRGEKLGDNEAFHIYSNQWKKPESNFFMDSDSLKERNPNDLDMPPLALKPPPGRVGSNLSEQPPLNPPPGKVEPLPPEPPTFLKVPPSASAPPPPAPAPPPPKPSTGPPRPPPLAAPPGPRPPPPPAAPGRKGSRPPPPLAPPGLKAPRPASGSVNPVEDDAPKTKLKPFFWDKVQASPDHSMVWNEIRSGSFQFNEEMIESLFGYAAGDKNKGEKKDSSSQPALPQFVQILEPKKAQNLSILLRALNATTEEVCDALHEGNELPVEFVQALLKMAPTADEELKLRLYSGELSQLGAAERFLKALIDIPFAFKRLEALLFMCTLHEEMTFVKESFATLEVACKELRNSRLFLKLLEAVLKTGNRMNDGTFRGGAQAFKLDTLLKLSDVKGTDGKTTLLHFVVQEIIRSEGVRAARTTRESKSFSSVKTEDLMAEETNEEMEEHFRNLGLQKVSSLSSELENVRKAANIDADGLTGTVHKMGYALSKARDFLKSEMNSSGEESGFQEALKDFVQSAEADIKKVLDEEKRITVLVRSTGDYFHGKAGKDEGLRLFLIVRDFLIMLDKVCKEVNDARRRKTKTAQKQSSTASTSSETRQPPPSLDPRQKLFPAMAERCLDQSSSDSDND
ncbi:PREDICTED: formin-like protein 5 [Tarenaya hassleriana]|uniref:formin-like protein 5 n=1 Tax=Tarenaya hassleriana TaxID=28532 RepID=UPI00053C200D|nr:PREDICTED: formin-like protein 5 [Tarenaya hassleriana]